MDFITELEITNVEAVTQASELFREEVFSQPLSNETEAFQTASPQVDLPGLRLVAQAGDGGFEEVEEQDESDMFAIDPDLKKAHEMMDSTVEHLKAGDWQSANKDFFETQKCYEKYYNNNPTTDPVELENRRRSNQDRARLATCIRNKLEWRGEQAQVDENYMDAQRLESQAEAFKASGMNEESRQAILEAQRKYKQFWLENPPANWIQEREKANTDKRMLDFNPFR